MKTRWGGRGAWLRAVAISTSLVLSPVPASADAASLADSLTGQARSDFKSAMLLFRDGDYAGSATKFRAAYAGSHDPRLLWNVAACEKNLRHYARVDQLVRQYLAEGSAVMPADGRVQAIQLLEAIRGFMSPLAITVDQPGATVFVDDDAVGTSPLAGPLTVDLGNHRVRAHLDEVGDVSALVEIAGSSTPVVVALAFASVHREAELSITSRDGATIAIDGKVVGPAPWRGTLPAGPHGIRVTAPGRVAYTAQIELAPRSRRTLDVVLDKERAVVWPWIVAGAVVAAGGLAVGGYFLFRPRNEAAPSTVTGTLPPGIVTLPFSR